MKNVKLKPTKSRPALREAAKPLNMPEASPLRADHPMSVIVAQAAPVTPVTRVIPQEAAPKRDFTRTANSIVRDAVPSGVFTGKAKQLYDYLYSKTRGAIVPTRTTRLRTGDVMRGAGMTRPTYRSHLARLTAYGLVQVEEKGGQHDGNLFTVLLPEETGYPGNRGNASKELDGQQGQESNPGNRGLTIDIPAISADPKTSFKTKDQDDDDPLRRLERELTGKSSPAANWQPLFQLLADELKTAAARTGSVSDVPAFFAAHLRRRLAKPDAPMRRSEGKRAAMTEPLPLAPEEIELPAPDDVEEFERARAELEGK